MKKLFFLPFKIISGIVAGKVGKRLYGHVWSLVDVEEPPDGSVHRTTMPKLILATALRGAVFSATKAAVDRGARASFFRLTGSWPGDEEPKPE